MNVFMIASMTADGYIGRDEKELSTTWTTTEDRHFFWNRTKAAGVMIMGRKTYDTIGKPLGKRVSIVYSRQALAGSQVLEKESDFLQVHPKETSLFSTSLSPKELILQLEKIGCEEVAICGGASIYSAFLTAGVINRLYLSIESVIFGSGLRLLQLSDNTEIALKLVNNQLLGEQTVLLEYEL